MVPVESLKASSLAFVGHAGAYGEGSLPLIQIGRKHTSSSCEVSEA